MVNWKKAVVIGSFTAGALLMIKGRRGPGAALTTVGLVVLATEYPDQFEQLWDHAPDYISRGAEIFSTVQRIAERFTDEAQRHGIPGALREVRSEYMG
jgi:hypothetical protein